MNDELSKGARNLLDLATSEGTLAPSAEDRARVQKNLGVAIAAGSAAGLAAGAAKASAATAGGAGGAGIAGVTAGGLGLKGLVLVAVVSGVAGVGVLALPSEPDAPAAIQTSGPSVSDESVRVPGVTSGPEEVAPSEPSPIAGANPPAPEAPEALHRPSNDGPSNDGPSSDGPALERPALEASATPTPTPHAIPATPREEVAPNVSLAEELRLLRAAQRARVGGDYDGALRQLDEHTRRFPAGSLSAEREGTRVLVLCDAERSTEAASARARFLREHPSSPLAHRVRGGCE